MCLFSKINACEKLFVKIMLKNIKKTFVHQRKSRTFAAHFGNVGIKKAFV